MEKSRFLKVFSAFFPSNLKERRLPLFSLSRFTGDLHQTHKEDAHNAADQKPDDKLYHKIVFPSLSIMPQSGKTIQSNTNHSFFSDGSFKGFFVIASRICASETWV